MTDTTITKLKFERVGFGLPVFVSNYHHEVLIDGVWQRIFSVVDARSTQMGEHYAVYGRRWHLNIDTEEADEIQIRSIT